MYLCEHIDIASVLVLLVTFYLVPIALIFLLLRFICRNYMAKINGKVFRLLTKVGLLIVSTLVVSLVIKIVSQ